MTCSGVEAAGHESSMNAERTRVGKLRFTMSDFATTLLGTIATSSPSVRMRIERQFICTTVPSILSPSEIRSPTLKGASIPNAIPANTSASVFCRARPKHDREDARGREQTADGQRKHGNQDNRYSSGVNRGGGEIGKEPRLAPSAVVIERE